MEHLRAGDLFIEAKEAPPGAPLQLIWHGKSNERHPASTLGPFFSRALAEGKARGVPVEMHFQGLDHFNSSTITSVIQLIQDARAGGVRLVIAYNAGLKWQKLSFEALRVFTRGDDLLELRASQP
jgi:hypothetical protein